MTDTRAEQTIVLKVMSPVARAGLRDGAGVAYCLLKDNS